MWFDCKEARVKFDYNSDLHKFIGGRSYSWIGREAGEILKHVDDILSDLL